MDLNKNEKSKALYSRQIIYRFLYSGEILPAVLGQAGDEGGVLELFIWCVAYPRVVILQFILTEINYYAKINLIS